MNINPTAKRVLLYGDSLVFGLMPAGVGRYDASLRFSGVLQKELGDGYEIIEEGLRGRMLAGENAFFPHRNGLVQFPGIFGSHAALDILVISLGTNDVNSGSKEVNEDFERNLGEYEKMLTWCTTAFKVPLPKVLLVAPPVVNEENSYKAFKDIFKGAGERSAQLGTLYKKVADKFGWGYLNLAELVQPSEDDGIHLTVEGNATAGHALAELIKKM